MTTPEQAVQEYASSHYGHLIVADEPSYCESEGVYVSSLRSDYPFLIRNDKPPRKKSLHILEIKNIGCITLDKESRIIKDRTSSRDECDRNLDSFFNLWKRRAEEIVVSASADNLAEISRCNHFFDPIDEILSSLWDYRCVNNKEIDFYRSATRRRRTQLYLRLLEGLGIVTKSEDGFNEGPLAITLRDIKTKEQSFRDAVISTLLRERYTTLRDVFKLTIFEPIIHIDNCIYLPELETEEAVYRNADSIMSDYLRYYNQRINPLSADMILKRLVNAKAISQEGEHYFGNPTLRKNMLSMKKKSAPISSELLVKA
jgi:hypothetical protein